MKLTSIFINRLASPNIKLSHLHVLLTSLVKISGRLELGLVVENTLSTNKALGLVPGNERNKKEKQWAGEMIRCLRVLAALLEVPTTHMVAHNRMKLQVHGIQHPLLSSLAPGTYMVHRHPCKQNAHMLR